ncbi:hypothetical protein Tco_0141222, partial [Tanacetum coccineum]
AEVDSGLKRKRATGDDGAGPSKRVRHLMLATKEVTETPPPNVEATSDSSASVTHAAQSPPQTGPKAFDGMPVDQLIEEFDMVTAQQAALVAQLRAKFSNERSQSQKDEEILLLKTQLADAQAEAESSRSYAQNLAEEKMALLVKVEQCPVSVHDICSWISSVPFLRPRCPRTFTRGTPLSKPAVDIATAQPVMDADAPVIIFMSVRVLHVSCLSARNLLFDSTKYW